MSHPSKTKGNAFERELVQAFQDADVPAKRAWGSNGEALGESAEVDLVAGELKIQAKRRKKLPEYLQIPEGANCVVFRQDRGRTLALVTLEDLIKWQR